MPYRVIQWATGYIGTAALRAIIQDPDLELVGVFVYSDKKPGQDAGVLAGLPPTGVLATSDFDAILALDADVVVHCASGLGPIAERDDHITRLLRSGKNVVSTMAYAAPAAHGPEYVAGLEEACRAGQASIMGGGINPDCVGSWLPAALSRLCTDVQRVSVVEIDDMSLDPHEGFMVDMLGIGKDLEHFSPSMDATQYMLWVIPEILTLLAQNFGAEAEISNMDFKVFTATRDVEIPIGTIREGTVCGARLILDGAVEGEPFLHLEIIYCVQRDHPDFPETPYDTRYIIEIEGSPSLRTTIDLAPTLDPDRERTSTEIQAVMHATAACAVRAIPAICAAEPGVFIMPVPGGWTVRNRPLSRER